MSGSMLVIDVPELGQEAMIVNTTGPRLLLLEESLEHDRRIEILEHIAEKYAED